MNRLYEIFKTPRGPSIVKALLNHTIFSPSQTGETVPLSHARTGIGARQTCYGCGGSIFETDLLRDIAR
jgi:hypothetical protein